MIKTKMLAVLMVSLMMAVTVVPMIGEESDAAVGDGGYYSYTLNYTSANMGKDQSVYSALSMDGMDAINHPSYDGTTTTGYGSWTWNAETGIGPFNSFYAAFDMTDGNKMVAVLDPFDLTKKIDGTSLDDMSKYNIMWVLPTVYWKATSTSVTLTNDPSTGGTAFAHTINGKVREYVAYGVYESGMAAVNSTNVLTSQSDVTPLGSTTLADFRTYSHNYTMDSSLNATDNTPAYSMLWNYYQWELYRLCSFTVMENLNSQYVVGNGYVWADNYTGTTTGATNTSGPYAGNTNDISLQENCQSSVKLFIENAWGSYFELIDGVSHYKNDNNIYLDSSNAPSDSKTGPYVISNPSSIFIDDRRYNSTNRNLLNTTDYLWALPSNFSATLDDSTWSNAGTCDMQYPNYANTSDQACYVVGGTTWNVNTEGFYKDYAGISCVRGVDSVSGGTGGVSNTSTTSRLAFVYGDVIASITVQDDSSTYGTVSTTGFTTGAGSVLTVDGNTITDGTDVLVTATPNAPSNTMVYSFAGWYNGSTLISDGDLTVTGDMTLTAHFSQAVRLYDVTFTSSNTDYGTVSSALVQVPYNTTIASATDTITLGTTPDVTVVTATPTTSDAQYTYAFSDWTGVPVGGYITEATSITANFTQTLNSYTITWVIGETSTTETYDYGEMPTHENPTPPEGYYFAGWNPEIATVTADQTYTAVFSNMTVTFDAGKGTLDGGASKVVVIGQPIGELPTCTAPTNYTFDGWYTAASGGTKVTEDTVVTQEASFTLYAHYELVPALQPVKAILDILPILMAVGLILGAVYVFITRPELATGNNLLYAIVGISVTILVLATFVIPIIGGAL